MTFKLEHPPEEDKKGRRVLDYYPTPAWCVTTLFERCPPPTDVLVEPSAGDGAIIRQSVMIDPRRRFWACEIQEQFRQPLVTLVGEQRTFIGDFFDPVFQESVRKLCAKERVSFIGNPPYELALEFCDTILGAGARYLAMLLRLDFLGSRKRKQFWMLNPLSKLVVLARRPKFKGGTGTDLYNYGWYIWERDERGRPIYHTPPIVSAA